MISDTNYLKSCYDVIKRNKDKMLPGLDGNALEALD